MTQVTRTYNDAEWRLAPKEPTQEMIDNTAFFGGIDEARITYIAMLAAAPQPPGEQGSPAATDELTAEAVRFMAIFDKACEQPDPWAYLLGAANLQTLQGAIDDRLKQSRPAVVMTDAEIIKACRDVGGIVHSDGNMFFPNPRKFREATALLARAAVQGSEKRDAERYRYVKKIAFDSELPGQTKEEFEKYIDDGIDKHIKGER